MYKFKRVILGLSIVSCMIHGAAETKVAQESAGPEYVVEVVPVKQMRLPCGLARLRDRCCGKPLPVIVNTTDKTIPIGYSQLDIDIPYAGGVCGRTFVVHKVDHAGDLRGKETIVVTPSRDDDDILEDIKHNRTRNFQIPYSELKYSFRTMQTPYGCCPHCTANTDYTCLGRNPKKFSLFPDVYKNILYHNTQWKPTGSNPMIELKPGFIYRIVANAKKKS